MGNQPASAIEEIGNRLLVVYDGRCGLCNRTVRWLLRRDRRDLLRFTPSSNPAIAELLARHGIQLAGPDSGPDSILVFCDLGTPAETLIIRSNAILACLRELPQLWPALAAILRIVPNPVRDLGYRLIARIRYRVWGRYDTCPLPTSEERRHFV